MTKNKKLFVLDTNILIHEPTAFLSFEEHDVVIPMTVLEELDRIKDRKNAVSHDARIAIKSIEKVFTDSTSEEIKAGVKLPPLDGKERGSLSIFSDYELKSDSLNGSKDGGEAKSFAGHYDSPDNLIISATIHLQEENKDREVILVTKDICMRLKSKQVANIKSEDFKSDHVVEDVKFLTKGYEKFSGDFWEPINECEMLQLKDESKTYYKVKSEHFSAPFLNQYLIDENKNGDFAARIVDIDSEHVVLQDIGKNRLFGKSAWGIKPRNIQQAMAMHALLDPEMDLVMLTGSAGSGKTLLALASALEMVVEQKLYEKIIVTRSTPSIAEEIGFLPGTETEKMAPWLAAISDSLEALHNSDENKQGSIDYIMQVANIQYKSMNFMRGRSIQNSIVLLDESQNLTPSQLKTIITRCGENTKIICLGNLAQIDHNFISATTSGLTYAVDKFKMFEGSASINLNGVMRSRLASFAEENL